MARAPCSFRAVATPAALMALIVGLNSAAEGKSVQEALSVCEDPDFPSPVLCRRAGLDTLQASFIVVVDESGSMQGMWPAVKAAVASLGDAIPGSDQVRLVLFSGTAREMAMPWSAERGTRSAWQRQVEQLPAPRGQHTDLARSLEKALEILRAEPPERQQFVFILTDGLHDPPPDSPYPIASRAAWQERLRQEVRTLAAVRPLRFTVVRLGAAADPQALIEILEGASVVEVHDGVALRDWFASTTREFQVSKLRLAVARDRLQPFARISVSEPPRIASRRAAKTSFSIASPRILLGASVESDVRLESSPVLFRMPGFLLDPGEEIELEGTVEDLQSPPWNPPGWQSRSLDTTYLERVRLEPADELSRIGIDPDARESLDLTVAYAAGGWFLSWPAYIVSIFGVLIVVGLTVQQIRWALYQPSLAGHQLARAVLESTEEGEAIPLAGRSWEATGENGLVLFKLLAKKHRGRTRIAVEARGPEVVLEPPHASRGDLRPNDRLRVTGPGGEQVEYRLLSSRG